MLDTNAREYKKQLEGHWKRVLLAGTRVNSVGRCSTASGEKKKHRKDRERMMEDQRIKKENEIMKDRIDKRVRVEALKNFKEMYLDENKFSKPKRVRKPVVSIPVDLTHIKGYYSTTPANDTSIPRVVSSKRPATSMSENNKRYKMLQEIFEMKEKYYKALDNRNEFNAMLEDTREKRFTQLPTKLEDEEYGRVPQSAQSGSQRKMRGKFRVLLKGGQPTDEDQASGNRKMEFYDKYFVKEWKLTKDRNEIDEEKLPHDWKEYEEMKRRKTPEVRNWQVTVPKLRQEKLQTIAALRMSKSPSPPQEHPRKPQVPRGFFLKKGKS